MKSGARWDLWGALAGAVLGASDFLLLSSLGANMVIGGRDAAATLLAFLVSAFALLGYAAGRLARARARARADAETIKRQIEELERAQQAAVQQEKLAALGRLAAGLAHEIRNPLGVIRASASLVREGFQPGEDAYRACQFICEETDRLNGLVHSLLSLSRPAPLRAEPVDLTTVIGRGLQLADNALAHRGIEARQAIADPLPRVWGDPDLLTQALLNLLLNAAESLEGRGGRVLVRLVCEGDEVHLDVADDGPGIPAEDEKKVFEPFFTTKPKGSGLGLPIAQRIAEVHGGRIDFLPALGSGRHGSGACFRLSLPLERKRAEVLG